MATVAFSPPSPILTSPVHLESAAPPASDNSKKRKKSHANQKQPAKSRFQAAAEGPAGVTKPKQSKSRNGKLHLTSGLDDLSYKPSSDLISNWSLTRHSGCVTCKLKRLKCDETKPTCENCKRRKVSCGGYKKDFKWKPCDENSFISYKPPSPSRSRRSESVQRSRSIPADVSEDSQYVRHGASQQQGSGSSSDESGSVTSPTMALPNTPHTPSSTFFQCSPVESSSKPYPISQNYCNGASSSTYVPSPWLKKANLEYGRGARTSVDRPSFLEPLFPGSGSRGPCELPASLPYEQGLDADATSAIVHAGAMDQDEEIEEVERFPPASTDSILVHAHSSTIASLEPYTPTAENPCFLLCQPRLSGDSPEMLLMNFDHNTCGILSVKNGRNENPWRTMVWPLAKVIPALYHAISSMSAFHASKSRQDMKVHGIAHVNKSLENLRENMNTMPVEASLATSLALAFAESWDTHVSTGIKHLHHGKILVNLALTKIQQKPMPAMDVARIKFLCNTWLYMDVLARLTSIDVDERIEIDVGLWSQIDPEGNGEEIDPLMGCASTLFPIIGRVANLVRRVRESAYNSLSTISTANKLKRDLEDWAPPKHLNRPEDPDCEITHSIQTAEAYRLATLLYLHQAVPEIPSRSCARLAYLALVQLAAVPVTSRTVIVHIYPLLAAGCEASSKEDRNWVKERWETMSQKMQIGNVDKCLHVVQEVWRRRDQARRQYKTLFESLDSDVELLPAISNFTMPDSFGTNQTWRPGSNYIKREDAQMFQHSPMVSESSELAPLDMHQSHPRRDSVEAPESISPERTIRGQQHWVGVMKEWNWEGIFPTTVQV